MRKDWRKIDPRTLIGRHVAIEGHSIVPTREEFKISGIVTDANDDFINIREDGGDEQEYVWRRGFYGAHGDLDGISDLLAEGHVTMIKPERLRHP